MTETDNRLDFLCVGFTKCGTTSLHHYLKGHPQICLPHDKESPFFDVNTITMEKWNDYVIKSFPNRPGLLRGKVTPRYTASPLTPRKIHSLFPNVKIIFLIRNPVERLFSYFKMMKRLGRFDGSFNDFINMQLAIDTSSGGVYSPIQQGLYYKIISVFREFFPPGNMLIEFTDDMEQRPREFLKRVLSFLAVDNEFLPPDLNKKYYKGSSQSRFPSLTGRLLKSGLLKNAWHLVPYSVRMKLLAWYYTEFNIVKSGTDRMPPEAGQLLAKYYREDVAKLEQLLNIRVPWPAFQQRESVKSA